MSPSTAAMGLRPAVRLIHTLSAAAALTAGSLAIPAASAHAAELAPALQKLATCEDSWYDLRQDQARMESIGVALRSQFAPQDRSPVWKPTGAVTWLGAEVLEMTPQSVGMGLGFALTLKSPASTVQPAYERVLGQAMDRCDSGDGMRSCERRLAEKRTAVLMSPLSRPELGTLVGCYYFYQQ